MAIFNYDGRQQDGKKITGNLEAESVDKVVEFLESRSIVPINIKAGKSRGRSIFSFLTDVSVRPQEVLNFARQMATLIAAGVPIIKSVKELAGAAKSKGMQKTLLGVAGGLEAGKSLAATLADYPKVFSSIFVSLIEVGENIGHLDDVFARLALFLEMKISNRRRLVAAVRYPIIVITAIVIALVVMNIFVVPKFGSLFARFGTDLPLPTRMLVTLSNFMLHNWGKLLVGLVAVIIVVRYLLTVPGIRLVWDKYKLKFPILGNLQQRIMLSQFTQTFSMILHSGVPMLKGITLGANATENKYVTRQILFMRDTIEKGEDFSYAANLSKLFDPGVLQMIEVGEETGKLDEMLGKVADAYGEEIDYDLKNLSALLEPMLLMVVGAMVALMALAIYLPMWDIVKFAR